MPTKKIKLGGVVREVPDWWGPSEIKLYAQKLKTQRETAVVGGEEIDVGTARQAPQPPATVAQMVSGERKLESGYTMNPRTGQPQAPSPDTEIPDLIEMVIGGGPAKRLPAGVALGMVGRAAGDVARAALTDEPVPKDIGEFAESMGEAGLTSLAGEAVGRAGATLIGGAANLIRNWLGGKVPARQAMELIADQISAGKITPKELTTLMREAFDTQKTEAGKAVGKALTSASEAASKNKAFQPSAEQTLNVLNEEIKNIQEKLPTASKEVGDKLRDLLGVLKGQRDRLPRIVDGKLVIPSAQPFSGPKLAPTTYTPTTEIAPQEAVQKINEIRRDFFHAARETNYREAKRIDRRLSGAASADIEKSFQDVGMDIPEVKAANKRFAGLSEIGETDKLKNLFGLPKFRKSPGAVMQVVRQEPELATEAIETISKDPRAIADVRKAIFQDLFDFKKLTSKEGGIANPVIDATFGTEAKKVKNFIRILDEARDDASRGIVGTVVNALRIGVGGKGSIILNDASGPILEIPAHKIAQALGKNPKLIDVLIDGFSKPATTQKGGQLARALFTAISEINRENQ